jgi:hypothetical protein
MIKKGILTGLLLLLLSSIYSLDIAISRSELELKITPEYNRSFYFCWDIMAVGSLEINNLVTIKGGLAMGMTGITFDINTVISGEVDLPFWSPLFFGLGYTYNGLPGYKTNTHTLLPAVSVRGKWAGITIGPALRFTGFDSVVIFEPLLAVSAFANFYNTEKLRIGIRVANFSEFMAGNFRDFLGGQLCKFRMGVESRSDGGTAERELAHGVKRFDYHFSGFGEHRAPCADLAAEPERRCIHEVGATDFYDFFIFIGELIKRAPQLIYRRQ